MNNNANALGLTTVSLVDDAAHPNVDSYGVESSPVTVEIGQWYWVKDCDKTWDEATKKYKETPYEWLGCVMHVGSNYLELRSPPKPNSGYSYTRMHFDDYWKELRFEPNPEVVIRGQIEHYQALASKHLAEVKAITARLGVSSQASIKGHSTSGGKAENALMVVSGQQDIKQYENALVLAKDKLLPELFEAIKHANGEVTRWMTANTLPMEAMTNGMKGTINDIKDRIFNVSLYAGLTEQAVRCRDGDPAAYHEKLRVMQRMLYMDEECLLNYRHGGMEFRNIASFDAWISEDVNRDRILPFPRCLVAMRVRRNGKDRKWDGSIRSLFINIELAESDKFTFLYIRNGDQVHRLSCDLDFGETIFPDKVVFDPSVPVMVKMFANKVEQIITRDDYDVRVVEERQRKKLSSKWEKENPKKAWELEKPNMVWSWANPYRDNSRFVPHEWKPFDHSNVYFDDIAEKFAEQIKEHNRIALIIQGLFDRSDVLHPHPPAKIWSPDGFAAVIELIYDASTTLHDGEAPDFEAYMRRCNESLDLESVVIGQEVFWMEKEAEKECRRRDGDWRDKSEYRPKTFKPHGNPGPGYIARMAHWKPRSRVATFTWNRERQTSDYWKGKRYGDPVLTSITVPADRLFNVSAYRPGDYLQFFQDFRTRQAYLKWAPMLLAAEEYHAGKDMNVQNPV